MLPKPIAMIFERFKEAPRQSARVFWAQRLASEVVAWLSDDSIEHDPQDLVTANSWVEYTTETVKDLEDYGSVARKRRTNVISEAAVDKAEAAWSLYRQTKNQAARDTIIETYIPLIERVATRIHRRLPREVEGNDLFQEGVFGLMHAIDRFDPDRGLQFSTYAVQIIQSAILDYLRSLDWVPRLTRRRYKILEKAHNELRKTLGRIPTQEELFLHLGVSRKEFVSIMRDSSLSELHSLDAEYYSDGSSLAARKDMISDRTAVSPVTETHRKVLKDLVISRLSRSERMVVVLYYYEQMSMREIGIVLDLSESRVSQMHSSIMARLKIQLANRIDDL